MSSSNPQNSNWFRRLIGGWIGNPYTLPQTPSGLYSAQRGLYQYRMIGNDSPVLVDASYGMLWNVYIGSPLLRVVIDEGAKMFANADVYVVDKDGNRIDAHPVTKLMNQPTPTHSREDWLRWWWVMDGIYSNTFIKPLRAMNNSVPAAMWLLPSADIEIKPTGKIYEQYDISGIIEYYRFVSDATKKYTPDQIIQMVTNMGSLPYLGESNIPSLQYPISNSNAGLKTQNVNLTRSGAKGILSSGSKDSDGGIPLGKDEREHIQTSWIQGYGIDESQSPINITSATVQWVPITLPLKDMLINETVEECFGMICAKYGMRRDLFPSTKGATNENQQQAERGTYQSTIIPKADSLAGRLTTNFKKHGNLKEGERLIFDYNWLPCMQKNKTEEATHFKTITDGIKILIDSNVANPAQAEIMFEQLTGIKIDEALKVDNKIIEALKQLPPLVANKFADQLLVNEAREAMEAAAIMGDEGNKRIGDKPQANVPQ